jgi:hypothetical protein
MLAVRRNDLGLWAVFSGKHAGLSFEEVAQKDPGYLTWAWNTPSVYDYLEDAAAHALDDVMTKYGVPFDWPKKARSASS